MKRLIQKNWILYLSAILLAGFLLPTSYTNAQYFPLNKAPSASTLSATNVTNKEGTLNASINPNGSYAYVWFEYGTGPNSLDSIVGYQSVGYGSASVRLSSTLTNLDPNKKYYYRIVAQNPYGAVKGSVVYFTTQGATVGNPPIVFTNQVSFVKNDSVTLTGTVNPNYLYTTAWFEYGTEINSLKYVTNYQSAGNGSKNRTISAYLKDLQKSVYYYRFVAQSPAGTVYGNTLSFSNESIIPAVPAPAVPVEPVSQPEIKPSAKPQETAAVPKAPYHLVDIFAGSAAGKGVVDMAPEQKITKETVVLKPSIDIANPVAGQEVIYTLNYTNNGIETLHLSRLTLELPRGVVYESSSLRNLSDLPDNLEFYVGDIGSYGEGTITVKLKINGSVRPDTALVLNAVLNYADSGNVSKSANSYLAANVKSPIVATASVVDSLSPLFNSWFFDLALGLILAYGIYRFFIRSGEADLAA